MDSYPPDDGCADSRDRAEVWPHRDVADVTYLAELGETDHDIVAAERFQARG